MSFAQHPNYRETGIRALPNIPSEWRLVRLRQLGRLLKGSGGSKEDAVEEGVPCVRYGDLYTTHQFHIRHARTCVSPERAREYTPLQRGDVLFAGSGEKMAEIGKSAVNLIDGPTVAGGDLIILRPDEGLSEFLGYACDSAFAAAQKASMGRGTTIKHIYPDELRQLLMPMPSLAEQHAIVEFLDRETSKIDALVEAQQLLIGLLKEKRQALATLAVTKGIDPHVPKKRSGIDSLGEIPSHWIVGPVKRFFTSLDGLRVPLSSDERSARGGPYPYYGASGIIDFVDSRIFSEPLVLVAEDGANLLSRATPVAFVASGEYWVNNHAHVLKPLDGECSFWAARLESLDFSPIVTGSAQPKLTAEALGEIRISAPPTHEERSRIAGRIASDSDALSGQIAMCEKYVELANERRMTLISAAVTGQIDVRGLAGMQAA